MESVLNSLESKYLSFKLGEEQREALLSIFSFINIPGFGEYSFYGAAGTGKSSCTKLIISYLEQKHIPYQLVCPTHKSKKILANLTGREVITIHQLLALKPTIDILNLDMKDLQFDIKSSDSTPYEGVIIVDECSMVNDILYNAIIESCKVKNCKVIFQGDSKQIYAVKQHTIAKTFSCDNQFELTQVYRQSGENCVRDILDNLRKKVMYEFNNQSSKDGEIKVFSDYKELLREIFPLYKESVEQNNPNKIKLVAYTNKRVHAFNRVIRQLLFKDKLNEYNVGDILFGYDGSSGIENSGDYQVKSAIRTTKTIAEIDLIGWYLEVWDFDEDLYKTFFVLSEDNPQEKFEELAQNIEAVRIMAISSQGFARKKLWTDYYKIMGEFLTPIDLICNDRVVRCKSIDFGYAITSHKSQSSSYDNVAVDIGNILKCQDKGQVRQMEYVAISRTRKDVFILT